MKPNTTQNSWQPFPEAQTIIHAEQLYLQSILAELKGSVLICFDNVIDEHNLNRLSVNKYWYYQTEEANAKKPLIIGDYTDLALLSDSIDHFILPHIFDFSDNNREIIKEVWRCLAPEGKLIITGFNSYSLFGLPKFFKKLAYSQHLLSEPKLRQLLISEGFYIESYKTFYFRPSFLYGKEDALSRFLEVLGNILWPMMGCLHVFVAQKPVLGMTPLLETSKAKEVILPKAVAAPTTNQL